VEKPIRIHDWKTVHASQDPYRAPESRGLAISGKVAPGADPRRPEGSSITTSAIDVSSIRGRRFRTRSGTLYVLGTIDPKFRAWLRKERPNWNHRKPLTIKE